MSSISPSKVPFIFQPVMTDLLIPLLLLLVGAFGRKLARTGGGWLIEDMYLGQDLCVAALGAGLLKIFDLGRQIPAVSTSNVGLFVYDMGMSAVLLVIVFFLFIFVLCEHRSCLANTNPKPKLARVRLAIFCNALGFGSLTSFMILIKPFQ
jgi:hypothetical protein